MKPPIQPVVTGHWMGKEWVILEGLKAGDKVIVDNIIKLRPGTREYAACARRGTPAAPARPTRESRLRPDYHS